MVPRRKKKVSDPPNRCALGECMAMIGGAWTPNVIWYLSNGPRRYSELKSDLTGISSKTLSLRLKQLEENRLVSRQVMDTSPPTVEYSLTELGLELKPAIDAIVSVGHRLKELNSSEV